MFCVWSIALALFIAAPVFAQPGFSLESLAQPADYQTGRVSSFDRSGGNNDRISIQPGETVTLAEIEGPGAITHIWNTISAEKYYPRMLILRIYWDGQDVPSVEAPLGDFFGVGHGLERPFQSAVEAVSSEGRARNCYWYMPFARSARVTLTHEGFDEVRAFYYAIEYRQFAQPQPGALYFHAQYRQAAPNSGAGLGETNLDGANNYLILDTKGRGQYVGTVLSAQANQDGWFGEGDDMFYIDGSKSPTMTGTGTEDYFNDAWGFREFCYPFYGVTLWEGSHKGDRTTAYRWHIADPVSFHDSLRVSIEHGHANDRQDDFCSVAFWYQTLPSPAPPVMANVMDRLPDEGILYAKRRFLQKQIAVHRNQGRLEAALEAAEQFNQDNPGADEYGYLSLRRGLLEQEMGERDKAIGFLQTAASLADKPDPHGEQDAQLIKKTAERELQTLREGRPAWAYIAGADSFELYWNGEKIGEGNSWVNLDGVEVKNPRGGDVVIGLRCKLSPDRPGVAFHMGYQTGVISAGEDWKFSYQEQEGWASPKFDDSRWANASIVGQLGEGAWSSIRPVYSFMSPILTGKVMGPPEPAQQSVWAYFRGKFRLR
ncbi:MAG: DUF2961 domain-containing protein [bacterium]|nr:DUF2961 domain-containing protein [bacterium]